MMHLKATAFLILLMRYFHFVNVLPKKIDWNIPPQNVLNKEEINWRKRNDLNGIYGVELHIFIKTQPDAGKVIFSVGEGDNMKNYTVSIVRDADDEDLQQCQIQYCQMMISSGQKIKLLYNGKRNLKIRVGPSSYFHLIHVNTSKVDQKLACKTNSGKINNLSIFYFLINSCSL